MTETAIIGGTGLSSLPNLEITRRQVIQTPYGEPSGPLTRGHLAGKPVIFLARHGYTHRIPPHQVNYRANLWALRELGVTHVIAIAAVGGISPETQPSSLVIPDQIVDYTYGRAHTFFEGDLEAVHHIDFTYPYCETLRQILLGSAQSHELRVKPSGTYAATPGPRLETAAEIDRLARDGCDVVGMTGMPEAALARELDLCYATCAVVANWAAGRGEGEILMSEIDRHLKVGIKRAHTLLEASVARLD